MTEKNGGPAFARPIGRNYEHNDSQQGMSLRDFMAAAALIGLIAKDGPHAISAQKAYVVADEMLKARK